MYIMLQNLCIVSFLDSFWSRDKNANFDFDIVLHDGNSCVGENWNKVSKSVKYYFAILNLK